MAKIYSFIYGFFKDKFNFNLKGAGFFLRNIKRDFIIEVNGKKMFLNHKVAGCYLRLINGVYTEPETHLFLERVIESIESKITFIDVGANIGEMVIDVARYDNVSNVFGFEPYYECAKVCELSADLNGYKKIRIFQKVLSNNTTSVKFIFNSKSPNASRIAFSKNNNYYQINPSTLDVEFKDFMGPSIILIDVEGAEHLVLQGGINFVKRNKPLIIFEYNKLSRHYFNLDEIKDILGDNYLIFRLRKNGFLDNNLDETWNCVALHLDSVFYTPCQYLVE